VANKRENNKSPSDAPRLEGSPPVVGGLPGEGKEIHAGKARSCRRIFIIGAFMGVAAITLGLTDEETASSVRTINLPEAGLPTHDAEAERISEKVLKSKHEWHVYNGICDAFPRLKQNITQNTYQVMISTLVFEDPWYLKFYFNNLLHFTTKDTVIVAHLSAMSNCTEKDMLDIVNHHPRLLLNCHQFYTQKYHGSLAHAHIQNILWAEEIKLKYQTIMLMSSNSFLIRPGVEAYTRKHSASLNASGLSFLRELKRAQMPNAPRDGWSAVSVASRVYHWPPFRRIILEENKNSSISPKDIVITTGKHEGAFFPGKLILRLAKRMAQDSKAFHTMRNQLTYFEEFLFHTWAKRHLNDSSLYGHNTIMFCYWKTLRRKGWDGCARKAVMEGFFGLKARCRKQNNSVDIGIRKFIGSLAGKFTTVVEEL